jgi:hypothetical protein
MHELLVDVLPWLAAFLVLDGLVELRRGHLLLRSGGGPLRPARGGLRLVWPWPAAEAVLLQDLPWLPAATALHLVAPGRRGELRVVEPADLAPLPWAGLAPRAEGKKVLSGERLLLATPHPAVAAALAAGLRGLAGAPEADRAAGAGNGVRDLEAALDLRARQRPWLRPLRLVAWLLWTGLFVVGGALAYASPGGGPGAGALLLGLLGLLLVQAALALAMLRRCGVPLGAALTRALGLVAWPVAALRPLATLSTPLYAGLDALSVAAALAPPAAFHALAASELARLDASRRACGPPLAPAWDARERRLEALLERTGGSATEARRPPVAQPGEARWCPVCRCGFLAGPERCADCGAPLRPFA